MRSEGGLKIEPCGTPQVTDFPKQQQLPTQQSLYNLNHFKMFPEKPKLMDKAPRNRYVKGRSQIKKELKRLCINHL